MDFDELAGIAEELHAAPTTEATAEQIIKGLSEMLEMDQAGLTMIRGAGRLETVAATDLVPHHADRLQTQLGEGPAFSDDWDQTLRLGDLALERRWPRWTKGLAELGVASLLAVSLAPESKRIGVVTLYSAEPRRFDDDDAAFAHLFARHAAIALASSERETNLKIALDARKLIGQAQGILMERFKIDDGEAFEVLKRYSQNHNQKLRVIAEQLVRTRQLPFH